MKAPRRRNALEISDQLASLGMNLSAGSNLDISSVSMSALSANLDDSLDLFRRCDPQPGIPE